jgi:alginate O-acetyltransferase complex protein AlgI
MIFADLFFIYIFLPLNILFYYLFKNRTYRNLVLVAFSLFFYAWGEPVLVMLMIFTATLNCMMGLVIADAKTQSIKRLGLIVAVIISLGLFVIFKYTGFIIQNLNDLFGLMLPIPNIALPIGISFYTFQALSYTIDVYRGDVQAQRSPLKFLMYISLYTQLVAGPIVRYSDIDNEVDVRHENLADISSGLTRFCIGLTKKVVVANTAGRLSAPLLDGDLAAQTTLGAWFGICLYALQIYYDFSGYSDMAIGLGNVFGFKFPENFIYPYISRSATEFWRRWHTSLGTFFRDYLYIPLGGNRKKWVRNLAITWFATGLWHGASWNFVIWGLYFGLLIFLERLFVLDILKTLPDFVSHVYLLFTVLIGWVLFYYTDMARLGTFIGLLFGRGGAGLYNTEVLILVANNLWWFIASIAFCAPLVPSFKKALQRLSVSRVGQAAVMVGQPVLGLLLLALCTALLVGQSYNPFLYYKF